jgi:hypothetical protein
MANHVACNRGLVTVAVFVDSLRFASIYQGPLEVNAQFPVVQYLP